MLSRLKNYISEPLFLNSIFIMINTGLGTVFSILFWMVAARSISVTDIGVASALISAALLIVNLSRLGMDNGLVRYLPNSDNKDRLYNTTLMVTIVIAFLITLLFLIFIPYISSTLSFLQDLWYAILFLSFIIFSSINTSQNTGLIALRRGKLLLLQNIFLGLRVPIIIIIAYLGISGIILSYQLAYLVTAIIGIIMLYRLGITIKPAFDRASIKDIFHFSIGNYTGSIFAMIPATIIPIMIINIAGADQNAYYYFAYSIASIFLIIPTATSTSLFVEGSHGQPLKSNIYKSFFTTLVIMLPLIVILFLFGSMIMQIVFAKAYSAESFEMLKILSLSFIFSSIPSIYLSIKKVQKDIRMINYLNFFNSLLLLALSYILLTYDGLMGIGYAWLISNILMSIIVILIMLKVDKMAILPAQANLSLIFKKAH